MVESLVIALREGVEAALVVGIILAYLRKIDRLSLQRYVYAGLGLAVVASLVGTIVLQFLNIDPENEYLEGALFGVAGILVATMVIWMWRTARDIRGEMEGRLASLVGQDSRRPAAQGYGLLAFTFVMVFREGIETVLFLAAATLGEFDLLALTGALIGLALAILFAVLLIKGSVRVNLSRFFTVTSFILFLLAVRLLAGSVHEFAEVGAIPMNREIMAVLGYLVRDNATLMIMMALLAAPVFMILWDTAGRRQQDSSLDELPSAERRKRIAAGRRERMWRASLSGAALMMILAMGSTVLASNRLIDPSPEPVVASNGSVHVELAEMEEGRLHKYVYDASGVLVRFMAMRHSDGSVHVGFDACAVCGAVGFMQDGDHAICKNCNAPIAISTIGEPGGCNPLPLEAQITADEVIIPVAELVEARGRFGR